jgi:arylsulfatase A-like enzyme
MKNRYFFLLPVLILCTAGIFPACRPNTTPRNIILVTLDTLRADHVSAVSPGKASTPNLDFLAGQGTLYKNCYSLIPITLPAHASMFFSEPPWLLKNYNNGQILRDKRGLPSLANIFEKNGFATAAFVSLGVVRAPFGLDKGFGTYEDAFPPWRWYLHAEEVNGRVFPWLESHKDGPFFLWIHYSDPHEPYTTPRAPDDLEISLNGEHIGTYCLKNYTVNTADLPLKTGINEILLEVRNDYEEYPFQARFDMFEMKGPGDDSGLKIEHYRGWHIRREDGIFFFKKTASIIVTNSGMPRHTTMTFRGKLIQPIETTRDNYRREVEYMDGEIGKLWAKLKELGLFQNTAIVAVGDHGEGLGEYLTDYLDRYIGHIHYLQDIYMRVPLIVYNPARPVATEVREEFVTLLDIAPSIMDIMGLKNPPHFQGRNLRTLPKGQFLEIFEETYKPEAEKDRFGILAYPWHVIFTPENNKYEVYNLTSDPEEYDNLYLKGSFPSNVLSLKQKLDAKTLEILKNKETFKPDKKDEEMLRSLGYIK